MIDKQQFNNTFQYYEADMIIEIIDMYAEEQPHLIQLLEQNLEDHDLIELKWNAHSLKGICAQLFDPVAQEHAKTLEDAALKSIFNVIDILLQDAPETLARLKKEYDYMKIYPLRPLKKFLAGFLGSFSEEDTVKLEELEKRFVANGMPQMLSDLKASSSMLKEELLVMKKEIGGK